MPTAARATPPYDPSHYDRLFAVEDRHAWFRARGELLGRLAADVTRDLPDGYRVLEVGCGTGAMLQVLERVCTRGDVVGMDLFPEGLHFARQRVSCQLVIGDANDPPFGQEFVLVSMFDVLEHLIDDEGVLRRMGDLLLPGGALLLTVPADPTLWSSFDVAARHQRRYELPALQAKLHQAGFEVEYITYFMQALAPLLRIYRRPPLLKGVRQTQAELRIIPGLNSMLYWILRREAEIIRRRKHLARGSSILAIARRPLP